MKATYIAISLFLASVLLSVVTYSQLPDQLAVHWTNGEVTGTLPAVAAITIMPAFMVILFLVNQFLIRVMRKMTSVQAKVEQVICAVLPGLLFVCHGLIIFSGLDYSINIEAIIGISLGVVMMIIGNIMPQVKRNAIFGARNRWTLQNDQVWAIVNRLAGKLFFACGLVIFIGAIIIPTYQMAVVLTSVLIIVIIIQRYSHVTYQRVTSN
ncbi:SdpI family protein [Alkalicoccobacillus plakortidis]|uniref:SdpI family protein n=1 Tax=Alkalicoccobacillus plakortidis TaxID=444060 RepID=A0ABT0XF07_9BACI|nr:SdpI family protein [Alkalicoccobacillus plakortidis]MCM2674486.1 SdpI family protein [Alkalicoccobacillus plakortidis]